MKKEELEKNNKISTFLRFLSLHIVYVSYHYFFHILVSQLFIWFYMAHIFEFCVLPIVCEWLLNDYCVPIPLCSGNTLSFTTWKKILFNVNNSCDVFGLIINCIDPHYNFFSYETKIREIFYYWLDFNSRISVFIHFNGSHDIVWHEMGIFSLSTLFMRHYEGEKKQLCFVLISNGNFQACQNCHTSGFHI